MYDQLTDLSFATIGYCQADPSPFWNLALVNSVLPSTQLSQIEETLKHHNRKPSVYFESREELSRLVTLLQDSGYQKINEDSWMFYNLQSVDQTHFKTVKKVTTESELIIFLETFNSCYQKNDPQNPYGELGNYLKVAKNAWNKYSKTGRLNYYIIYKNDQPVAVSTLNSYLSIGYISNVGSLRSVRGEGFGKAATLFCVQESTSLGNSVHCLATEESTYPNQFYRNIGFKTKFLAPLYVKSGQS